MTGPDNRQVRRVVGVAGKCCAGKDVVTHWLLERGWREINVDAIGHEALAARHKDIVAAFGPEIVGDGATVDRKKLGQRVFADRDELHRLEAIVHPWMRRRVSEIVVDYRNSIESAVPPGLVINAALLFYMELDHLCDTVLLVRAPLLERVRRAFRRDDLPLGQIVRRLWSQRHLDAQAYRSPAETITVDNDHSLDDLYRRLSENETLHDDRNGSDG